MAMLRVITAAILWAGSVAVAHAQDVKAGTTIFKRQCATCHAIGEKAINKVGPFLNGLENRQSGSVPGYNYSSANKNSGITWNEATFLEYIKDPRAKIPNTKMVYVGLKNEAQAKDLWAYIKQFGADGKTK